MLEAAHQNYSGKAPSIRFGPSTLVDADGDLKINRVSIGGDKFYDYTSMEYYFNVETSKIKLYSEDGQLRGGSGNKNEGKRKIVTMLDKEAQKWMKEQMSIQAEGHNRSSPSGLVLRSSSHPEKHEQLMRKYKPKNPFHTRTLDHLDNEGLEQDNTVAAIENMIAAMDNVCGKDKDIQTAAHSKQKQLQDLNNNGFIPTGK